MREIAVAIELAVHDEIVVTPAALRLGGSQPDRGRYASAWLRLRRSDGGLLAIRSAHASAPGLRVLPEQAPAEVEHRFLVVESGTPHAGALRGEVVIEAVLADEDEVEPRARSVRVPFGDGGARVNAG